MQPGVVRVKAAPQERSRYQVSFGQAYFAVQLQNLQHGDLLDEELNMQASIHTSVAQDRQILVYDTVVRMHRDLFASLAQ
jgi:hypothetical protein